MSWPSSATRSPSPWQYSGTTATLAREVRGPSHTGKGVAVVTSTVSKNATNDRTDLFGVALHFDSISCVKDLPENVAKVAGFKQAQIIVNPSALDQSLRRCKVGIVRGSVRFQLDHDDDLKTASTISGALQVFADRKTLFFYLCGSTRDGAASVRWARCAPNLREVSTGFYIREFTVLPAFGNEPNTIIVTGAELFEISLVQSGAFPRTSVEFL